MVVRPNSRLGNQLLLTPLLQEIEMLFPDCKVDLFVRGNLAPILFRNYPSVDRIIKLPPKPFKQLGNYLMTWIRLRKYNYDLVFNVDMNSSSGRLCTKWVQGKSKFFGESGGLLHIPDIVHMAKWPVYNFRSIVAQMGFGMDDQPPKPLSLHLNQEEINAGASLLKEIVGNDKPTIMFYTFATGSKCLSKGWWGGMFAELKARYGRDYNLLEVLPKENVSQIDFASLNYYSMDIREMGSVMHHGSVFITGDCGVMHLASSVGVPTIALFSQDNVLTYQPYNRGSSALNANLVEIKDLIRVVDGVLC